MTEKPNRWPDLRYEDWAATHKTVHLCTQMLGKSKLALSPIQPEWLGSALEVGARGLSTGAMPWGSASVEVSLDFIDHELRVAVSDGRYEAIGLDGGATIADTWARLLGIYDRLGIDVDLWDKPQEVADTTPMSIDARPAMYDTKAVERWWTVISAVRGVFDEWRSPYFGRTHVPFWWGAFDIAVLRFTGRSASAPLDRGYIMRYDLDAEFMNAGFWPGDESAPEPIFYAYLYPKPQGCELAPINAHGAAWIEQMGEWVMPYQAALETGDPHRAVCDFLDSVYAVAIEYGGWDPQQFTYEKPPAPGRG